MANDVRNIFGGIACFREVPGRALTTFGSGGAARYVLYPTSASELKRAIAVLSAEGIPYRVLGGGSNVLLPDEGYKGAIIRLSRMCEITVRGQAIRAGAGVRMARLARECAAAELSGAEFASGIPGEVGGGVYMNASAYGGGVSDILREVEVMIGGERQVLDARSFDMAYHRGGLPQGAILLSATFEAARGDTENILAYMRELAEKRRASQPHERSAGSVFRRTERGAAALYIEETGLKGTRIGGAELSAKHCNFIVNRGGATTADYFALGEKVRAAVCEQSGVTLEYEVERIYADG